MKYRIITENGKIIKEDLTESGADRLWNDYSGVYEDENGEYRIYIEQY